MDGAFYLIVNSLIGLLLLFFGLRLMKFAVALMGFVLGFSVTSSLLASSGWPEWALWLIPLIIGLALAAVAFAFYRFAVGFSIALFFFNITYGVATSFGQGETTSWIIAFVVGLGIFALVVGLKLVDMFFAIATAAQGASLLTMVVYALVTSGGISLMQGFDRVFSGDVAWYWLLTWIVLLVVGLSYQLRTKPSQPAAV